MRFEIAARSIRGGRSYQEDTWTLRALNGGDLSPSAASASGVVAPAGALVVVADGMGGEGGGAEASHVVAERFNGAFFAETSADLPPEDRLRFALEEANKGLLAAKGRRLDLKEKSGSTLIAGLVHDGGLHFLSVGDSSIWRFRDDEIHRINILHERAPEMDVRAAELDTEEAWDIVLNDTQRNSITAAVMGLPLEPQHCQVALRPIVASDVLIFASDGIETLSIEHLRRSAATILPKRNAAALAQALVRMAERLGTKDQDNTTVVVVRALPEPARTQILPVSRGTRAGAPPPNARNPADAPAEPVAKGGTVPTVWGSRAFPRGPWGAVSITAAAAALVAALALAYIVLPTWGEGPAEKTSHAAAASTVAAPASASTSGPSSPVSSFPGPSKPAKKDDSEKDTTPRPAARAQDSAATVPLPGPQGSPQGQAPIGGLPSPPQKDAVVDPASASNLPVSSAPQASTPAQAAKPDRKKRRAGADGTATDD